LETIFLFHFVLLALLLQPIVVSKDDLKEFLELRNLLFPFRRTLSAVFGAENHASVETESTL